MPRLARAREAGELERQAKATEKTILDLSGDLDAAKAERERQPTLEMKQAAAAGVADFRAQFEAAKLAELGKQQAREAFERFKAEQRAAELARQQTAEKAAQELARQREEAERKRQAEIERKQSKKERGNDGPNWSR